MKTKKEPSYEDGLEKDERISLSHLLAGTYAHRKLDPKTGQMIEVNSSF